MFWTQRTNVMSRCATINAMLSRISIVASVVLLLATGCNSYTGKTDFERMRESKDDFRALVTEMGGTTDYKMFNVLGEQGMAWIIDLNGSQFTAGQFDDFLDLLNLMKDYVAELNLSGSTITDDQFIRYDDAMHGRTVRELNLSGTAITDQAIEKMDNFYLLSKADFSETSITKPVVDEMLKRRRANKHTPPPFYKTAVKM